MSRTAARPALRPGEFIPLAALLMSLVALAIDTMLPALPAIGQDLGVSRRNDVQFIIAALFLGLGLGLGQLVFGPLSVAVGSHRGTGMLRLWAGTARAPSSRIVV